MYLTFSKSWLLNQKPWIQPWFSWWVAKPLLFYTFTLSSIKVPENSTPWETGSIWRTSCCLEESQWHGLVFFTVTCRKLQIHLVYALLPPLVLVPSVSSMVPCVFSDTLWVLNRTGWGKSRFTVVSIKNTVFLILLLIVIFSTWTTVNLPWPHLVLLLEWRTGQAFSHTEGNCKLKAEEWALPGYSLVSGDLPHCCDLVFWRREQAFHPKTQETKLFFIRS